ncbi:hypothetical protein ACHAXH_003209 [Discostella pseudostelligera]
MPKRRKESDHADANTPSLPSIADAASILAGDADDSGAAAVPHSKRKANLISNNNNGNTTPTINSDGGGGGGDSDDPTGKSTNAIPIFLKKTYRMIDTCDPEICSWTADGEMFVVKNPELFSSDIIPQYFDHNKFSSFARQLNFYGFRKIQTKPIRNNDFDQSTAKHVTFYNDKFKRGRYDLLKDITRSTRGGGGAGLAGSAAQASFVDQARELESLHSTVVLLEQQVHDLEMRMQTMVMKMEQEIQAKVEFAVMNLLSSSSGNKASALAAAAAARNVQQHRQSSTSSHHHGHASQFLGGGGGGSSGGMPSLPTFGETTSSGTYQNPNTSFGDASIIQSFGNLVRGWENNPLLGAHMARALSSGAAAAAVAAAAASQAASGNAEGGAGGSGQNDAAAGVPSGNAPSATGATLPPHPKQKSMPPPPAMGGGGGGGGSIGLHNLSTAGMSGLLGGVHHTPSSASANILRNAWEDKFFSSLMMADGTSAISRAASLAGLAAASAGGGGGMSGMGMVHQASGGLVGSGGTDMSGLVALAAAQQQMHQQQAAMVGQAQAAAAQAQAQAMQQAQTAVAAALMQQRASSFGINIGNSAAAAVAAAAAGTDPRLMRQSTAEILLEAAGELGNSSHSKGGGGGAGRGGGGKDDKGRQGGESQAEI